MPDQTRFATIVNEAKSRIKQITPQEAHDQQRAGAVLIDVREAEDSAREHAAGATLISRGVLELKIEDFVPDTATPIICYCGGGSRSALATESLQRMGYTNAVSMASGFKGWKQAGLPTE